jgi:hypothetical protein
MLKKSLWTLAACGSLLTIGLPGYIATRPGDIAGQNDTDLAISDPLADPSDNGIKYLYQAAAAIVWTSDDDALHAATLQAGARDHRESIQSLIEANGDALRKLELALAAPYFGLPEAPASDQEHTPEIPLETNHLVQLLELQSELASLEQEWEAAFSAAIEILRLARMVEGAERAVLTTTMMSVGYRADALRRLRRMTQEAPIDTARARRWIEALSVYPSDPNAWKRMWSAEYQQWKKLLTWITKRAETEHYDDAESGEELTLAPDEIVELNRQSKETLRVFADLTRAYQRASEGDCTDLDALNETPTDRPEANHERDSEEILFKVNAPDYREFFLARCAQDTALSATQTMIALKAYRDQNGYLPEVLDEVVPQFLAAIPRDAFDGNPIRYSRSRRLIYSVGSDGVEWSESGAEPGAYKQPTFVIEF